MAKADNRFGGFASARGSRRQGGGKGAAPGFHGEAEAPKSFESA
jgi:hypothetical protein